MIKRTKEFKKEKSHSSYWMGDFWDTKQVDESLSSSDKKNHDLYKLAATQRTISNFVRIVTGKNIPVRFNQIGDSYTDGRKVTISTTFNSTKDFDVAVGLALHEGMHIKSSNFNIISEIGDTVSRKSVKKADKLGIENWMKIVKDLLNYVEDRRIDYEIFQAAPGYREYYRSMYDKYFNAPEIDLGLLSQNKRTEDVGSYMFRIINLHNKNTQLDALKGLRDIMKAMDFKNLDRLKSTEDAYEVALKIFDIMLENLDAQEIQNRKDEKSEQKKQQKEQSDQGDGEGQGENDDDFGDEEQVAGSGASDYDGENDDDEDGDDSNGGESDDIEPETLTDEEFDEILENGFGDKNDDTKSQPIVLTERQEQILNDKIAEQEKFMDGEVEKENLSSSDSDELKTMEESGTEIKNVAKELGKYTHNGVDVIVVNKMTNNLLNSNTFPLTSAEYGNAGVHYTKEIERGIQIGKILGKRLQTRGESRTTVYNRQKLGKIDKRMIASLGFGNESVFQFKELDVYKKANIHVSIDASGSMDGEKWKQTLINVTALCKAVDMISNLEIQVTFRTSDNSKPYIVKAYDSREDSFSKVKKMFPCMVARGLTPEGLCYEAIMKSFLAVGTDFDSYFLNISDGEPYFSNKQISYSGNGAYEHTRQMIRKIESMGIKTLSYFIESRRSSNVPEEFKRMYGNGAKNINVTDVGQITKTMNQLFLKK